MSANPNVKRLFNYVGQSTDGETVTLTHICPRCGWGCEVSDRTCQAAWVKLNHQVSGHVCPERG